MPPALTVAQIVERLGGETQVAEYLKISRQAVNQWQRIPAEHIRDLVVLSDAMVLAGRQPERITLEQMLETHKKRARNAA
jgi:hypothetical protein